MQPISHTPLRGTGRKQQQTLQALQLDEALLNISTVSQAVGLSASSLYRKIAAGEFPQPIRMGKRCTRFKASAVRAWIQAQGAPAQSDGSPSHAPAMSVGREAVSHA